VITAAYSSNLIARTFIEETNVNNRKAIENLHGVTPIEIFVLTFLALGRLFSGFIFKDMFIGLGTDLFRHVVTLQPLNLYIEAEFLPLWIKLLPVLLSMSVFGVLLYDVDDFLDLRAYYLYHFLSNKWHFNTLHNYYVGITTLKLGYATFWVWDR